VQEALPTSTATWAAMTENRLVALPGRNGQRVQVLPQTVAPSERAASRSPLMSGSLFLLLPVIVVRTRCVVRCWGCDDDARAIVRCGINGATAKGGSGNCKGNDLLHECLLTIVHKTVDTRI
jgi:hypothetical protein